VTESERIVRELYEAHRGSPWHGPSRAAALADVTVEEAARQPSANGHGIWALVLHMDAWTREVARRMREGGRRVPVEGDWPALPKPSEAAWKAAVAALEQAHGEVAAAVRQSAAGRLDERVGTSGDVDGAGGGASYRVMLHGLAQHDAYHTGQISLLKRLYRDGAS
jgi:uncharacterized damage-inducible protein DinB